MASEIRDVSQEEALRSFRALIECDIERPTHSRAGLATLDRFFFSERIKAYKRGGPFFEILDDPVKGKKLREKALQYRGSLSMKVLYGTYQLYYGTVNAFRPQIAAWIYNQFKPSRILDITAGWGGRALAAISLGIPYIGIDSNVDLKRSYDGMLELVGGDVTMIYEPAEAVAYYMLPEYDLIFTSPPYFNVETYEHMPEYKGKQMFLNVFLMPTISKAWASLKKGGTMALNMPQEMTEPIVEMLGPAEMLMMPVAKRGKMQRPDGEPIWIWRKSEKQNARI
jgi:16S rRNA G966 N2-methylase RsmD